MIGKVATDATLWGWLQQCPWTESTSEGVEDRRFSEVACRSIPPGWPPFSQAQLEQLFFHARRASLIQ